MSETWQAHYRDHPVWEQLTAALDAAAASTLPASDIRIISVNALLAEAESHRSTPHILVTTASLDAASSALSNITGSLSGAIDNIFAGSPSHFERLAQVIRSWPSAGRHKLAGLSSQVAGLTLANDAHLQAMQDELASFKTKLEEARESYEAESARKLAEAEAAVEAYHETTTDTIETEITGLNKKLEALSLTLKELGAAQEVLDERAEKQSDLLDRAIGENAAQFAEQARVHDSEWKELAQTARTKSDAIISDMTGLRKQAQEILAATGSDATAGDYGAYADAQKKAANFWRVGAVVAFIIAGVLFIGVTLAPYFSPNTNQSIEWWEFILQRLATPAGVAGVALFMASESAGHRKQERIARQAHLTLAALDPFTANLDQDEKRAIRLQTALKLFVKDADYGLAKSTVEKSHGPTSQQDEQIPD